VAEVASSGDGADPLYKYLKSSVGGTLGDAIKWNFSKVCGVQGMIQRADDTASTLNTRFRFSYAVPL
jgi:glutathione peroxidase-family protein